MPNCIRPCEIRFSVANRLAVTVRSRTAGLVTQVPRRMCVVFVAINRSTAAKITVINGQALSGTVHLYQMTAASAQGQDPVHPVSIGTMPASGSSFTITLPALSVTTIDVR